MANEEHVALLQKSVPEWNAWRTQRIDVKPDLSKANLNGADLSKSNLNGAELSEADLTDADLTDADLIGTRLRRANLNRVRLTGANLDRAALIEASGKPPDTGPNFRSWPASSISKAS